MLIAEEGEVAVSWREGWGPGLAGSRVWTEGDEQESLARQGNYTLD